ncbi:ATP-binding protein [Sphingomonas sp.]|uniref:ATP-binding protein n=1 Tax=Sphingomonas sp. TaxID=28214 RepID=UPI0025DDEF50|nr:ATP-binding protein [Sphingomonas sp.]
MIAGFRRTLIVLLMLAGVPTGVQAQSAASAQARVDVAIADARATMLTDPHKAIDRALAARADAQRLTGVAGDIARATASWLLGEASVRDNQIQKGGALINEALASIVRVAPGTKLNADALLSRGNYNALTANVAGALTDIQAAFEIYRKIGETRSQAIALLTISALYLDANDYNGALKYVDQALDVYHGDPLLLVSMHNNRGDMLRELGRYREAEAEFNKAMDLARGLKSPALLLPILRNVARNELAAGLLDDADRTLAEAFHLLGPTASSEERAKVLAVSAQARLQRHDLNGARAQIEQAFAGLDSADDTQFWQARKTAYEIYKALGDKPNALAQLEALKVLDDKIGKLRASTNTALMAARFDSANQDLKIAKLQADDAKRKLDFEQAKARTQFWIFVGSGISAMIIVGMLGFGLVTIRRSRNEVRAANVDLESTNAALGKALAAKTEFLATTSHEIRTPLNGILGMTQVMLADQRLDEATRDRIGVVHGAGVSMRALVDDILDVAKMETGNLTIERAPVDLPAMLKDVSRMWEEQARDKGLGFELDLAAAPPRIESDPARLRQVVFNLLSNALKFTQSGTIQVSSGVIETSEGEQMTVVIRDSGIGIPRDKLELIFESFRQADAGTTRQFGGTGLGLAICRNIARAMGGDVTVASEQGEGSTFTFALPLVRLAEEAPVSAASDAAALLIVDKNPISRAMLKTLFASRVAALKIAGSIDEAVAALAAGGIGRVLIDEVTVAMNGDAEGGVRALTGVPVSLLWTNPEDADRARFAAAGVDQLIAKPIAGAALVNAIVTHPTNDDIASRAA